MMGHLMVCEVAFEKFGLFFLFFCSDALDTRVVSVFQLSTGPDTAKKKDK